MSDQTLFNNQEPQTPAPTVSNPNDLFTKQLASIVDESGRQKYESLDTALNALSHSQTYIPQLKSELSVRDDEINRLKLELEKHRSLEDVVSRLLPQENPQVEQPPVVPQSGVSEDNVAAVLERLLAEREQQSSGKANITLVSNTLTEKFGDKAQEVLANKASELGMSFDAMKNLAMSSPQAVLAYFGSSATNTPAPVTGGLQVPPVKQETTLEERLRLAEHKIRSSGVNNTNSNLVADLRKAAMAKFGITE